MEKIINGEYYKQFIPKQGLPEEIFKFYTINENLKNTLRNGYLWFSAPSVFNDPFDCYIDLISFQNSGDYIQKLVTKSYIGNRRERRAKGIEFKKKQELVGNTYKSIVSQALGQMGICCFSLNHAHTLMWSHYAGHHKGLCLVFNPWLDTFFQIAEVDYSDTFKPYNYFDQSESALFRMAIAKSKDWEYEQEVRIILTDRNGKQYFQKQALTGIIFGCKTSDHDIVEIQKLVLESGYKNIRYQQAYTETNTFKLSFREINN